jgi:hypothetical protein
MMTIDLEKKRDSASLAYSFVQIYFWFAACASARQREAVTRFSTTVGLGTCGLSQSIFSLDEEGISAEKFRFRKHDACAWHAWL